MLESANKQVTCTGGQFNPNVGANHATTQVFAPAIVEEEPEKKNSSVVANITSEEDLTNCSEPASVVYRKIISLTGPTIIGSILWYSAQAITNSFVGRRLGPDVFAKYTLGVSVTNLFGFSIGIGMNGALDAFISQAYGRDKQATRDIGVSMQRACFLSFLCSIPLAFLLIFGGPLFRLLFGDELGTGALEFTQHAVPNLVIGFAVNICTKVLQAINLPELVVYSSGIGAISCFIINYFFTHSVASAVASLTATLGIQLLVLCGLIRYHPQVTFWKHCAWPSRDAYSSEGIRQYLKIGLPSLLAVCAEWWAFEVLDIVAATISVHAVAAVNLVLTVGMSFFSIGLAIAVAASVLVGNAMGENRPVLARQYNRAGMTITLVFIAIEASIILFFRYEIAALFTSDPELTKTFCDMIIIMALYVCGDATQFVLQSIFRSAGKQKAAAKVVMLTLWAVGVPCSLILGKWLDFGAAGVMGGLLCGFFVEIPLMLVYQSRWDWSALALKASQSLEDVGVIGENAMEEGRGAGAGGGAPARDDKGKVKLDSDGDASCVYHVNGNEKGNTTDIRKAHAHTREQKPVAVAAGIMVSEDESARRFGGPDLGETIEECNVADPQLSTCARVIVASSEEEERAAVQRQLRAAVILTAAGAGGVHMLTTPTLTYVRRSRQVSPALRHATPSRDSLQPLSL